MVHQWLHPGGRSRSRVAPPFASTPSAPRSRRFGRLRYEPAAGVAPSPRGPGGWDIGPPRDGGGGSGVREPRRPRPHESPPAMCAATPGE